MVSIATDEIAMTYIFNIEYLCSALAFDEISSSCTSNLEGSRSNVTMMLQKAFAQTAEYKRSKLKESQRSHDQQQYCMIRPKGKKSVFSSWISYNLQWRDG